MTGRLPHPLRSLSAGAVVLVVSALIAAADMRECPGRFNEIENFGVGFALLAYGAALSSFRDRWTGCLRFGGAALAAGIGALIGTAMVRVPFL